MLKLKFFTDEHIAKAVVEQLRRREIDVLRCEDVDMKSVDDSALLEYAAANGYALLSMDDDVTKLHTRWGETSRSHGGIFYAPMAQFGGPQGIGSIVLFCAEWAELIGDDADELAANIQNGQLIANRRFRTLRRCPERIFPEANWRFWFKIEDSKAIFLPQTASRKVKHSRWRYQSPKIHPLSQLCAGF